MNAVKQLTKIDSRLVEARQELRAVGDEERKAKGELQDAEAALVSHFEQENVDELQPTDLHNALAKARSRAEQPWAQRREGKQRLVAKLESERACFVQDNLGELLAAQEPAAHAATERLTRALEEVGEAIGNWYGVAQQVTALLSPVDGIDGSDLPELYIDPVRHEVERALGRGIPTPLPRSVFAAEEDRTIRSAA